MRLPVIAALALLPLNAATAQLPSASITASEVGAGFVGGVVGFAVGGLVGAFIIPDAKSVETRFGVGAVTGWATGSVYAIDAAARAHQVRGSVTKGFIGAAGAAGVIALGTYLVQRVPKPVRPVVFVVQVAAALFVPTYAYNVGRK